MIFNSKKVLSRFLETFSYCFVEFLYNLTYRIWRPRRRWSSRHCFFPGPRLGFFRGWLWGWRRRHHLILPLRLFH